MFFVFCLFTIFLLQTPSISKYPKPGHSTLMHRPTILQTFVKKKLRMKIKPDAEIR